MFCGALPEPALRHVFSARKHADAVCLCADQEKCGAAAYAQRHAVTITACEGYGSVYPCRITRPFVCHHDDEVATSPMMRRFSPPSPRRPSHATCLFVVHAFVLTLRFVRLRQSQSVSYCLPVKGIRVLLPDVPDMLPTACEGEYNGQ